MLEHHEGRLPAWLAPEQVRVLPVHPEQRSYAEEVAILLRAQQVRASVDASSETLARRVAEAHGLRIPLLWVVGAREMAERSVTERGRAEDRKARPVLEAIGRAREVCAAPVSGGDGSDGGRTAARA